MDRHDAIVSFEPEPFWTLDLALATGGRPVSFSWGRGRVFEQDVAKVFEDMVASHTHGSVALYCP